MGLERSISPQNELQGDCENMAKGTSERLSMTMNRMEGMEGKGEKITKNQRLTTEGSVGRKQKGPMPKMNRVKTS